MQSPLAFGTFAGNKDPSPDHYIYAFGGEDKPLLKAYAASEHGIPDRELYSIQPYDSLLLYKEKDRSMTLLQNKVYLNGNEVPFCTLNKTRAKLCARTNHELPYIKPGSVEWKNVTIQFAMELQDLTPTLPDYSVKDKPSSIPPDGGLTPPTGNEPSDGIILQWDKPQYENSQVVEDVDHYLIYCSQGPFTDNPLPTYALPTDDRKKVAYYTGQETVFIPTLQKIRDENTYTITLQGCGSETIHDDLKIAEPLYLIYVTGVDKNGNEIKNIYEKAEACPSSYYLEHPPTEDPTGTLMVDYLAYQATVRQECWPQT